MKVRIKCAACGTVFSTEPPMCDTCQAHVLRGSSKGTVAWVPYLMIPLVDQGIGPFQTRAERDEFYRLLPIKYPDLVGQRIDCLQEVVEDTSEKRGPQVFLPSRKPS